MNTKEFGDPDDLHIDEQRGVVTLCSPEVSDHLFRLIKVQGEVVGSTLGCEVLHLFSDKDLSRENTDPEHSKPANPANNTL